MIREHVHVDVFLKPFRFWCQKVLPLVYDDSLSYYEVLAKLTKYINELIEMMKTISSAFDAIQDEFDDIKEEFDAIKEYYEGIREQFEALANDIQALQEDFDEYRTSNDADIADIREQIAAIPIITVDTELSENSENPVANNVLFSWYSNYISKVNEFTTDIDDIKETLDNLPQINIDDTLSSTSENPVQNKVITQALQGVTPATVDSDLSDSSTNPVQNRVITGALNTLSGDVGDLTTEVSSLSTSIDNTWELALENQQDILDLQPVVSSNTVKIDNLTARYEQLQSSLSLLNSKVTELEKQRFVVKVLGVVRGNVSGTNTYSYADFFDVKISDVPSDFVVNSTFNSSKYAIFALDTLIRDSGLISADPKCFVRNRVETPSVSIVEGNTKYRFSFTSTTYPSGTEFAQQVKKWKSVYMYYNLEETV